MLFVLIAVKPDPLRLSANQKKELFDFIKNTRNKEEYRRAIAVKHKMERQSFRTIAKILGVKYRHTRNTDSMEIRIPESSYQLAL
jgi:hypothetical protein